MPRKRELFNQLRTQHDVAATILVPTDKAGLQYGMQLLGLRFFADGVTWLTMLSSHSDPRQIYTQDSAVFSILSTAKWVLCKTGGGQQDMQQGLQ